MRGHESYSSVSTYAESENGARNEAEILRELTQFMRERLTTEVRQVHLVRNLDPTCMFCDAHPKDVGHSFFTCQFTKFIWNAFSRNEALTERLERNSRSHGVDHPTLNVLFNKIVNVEEFRLRKSRTLQEARQSSHSMARVARTCLRSILKIVNSTLGLVGIAMILYGLWMLRVWKRDKESPSFDDFDYTALWFIYTFLSIGATLCLITCLGHISADSSNGFCLSCVSFFKSVAADILLNSEWEKDLPEDPTGRLHDFREFVESNFDFFKWIAMLIILVQGSCQQGFSILLAMILRALGPNNGSKYDIDEEYTSARLPLINPHLQTPQYVVGEPRFSTKNDAWNVRILFQSTSEERTTISQSAV
ncbi:hypothetical protein DKX38_017081 [Salix brachista]|uniref:Reverse transcriptase zinc-binding domain-containing protein n=1 Tax=Salix brachista TaxID=2182728 RepID=A0A5N5KU69_9ROSI|nr:hypothetical protein DKX38_017081 [Salix brachista]